MCVIDDDRTRANEIARHHTERLERLRTAAAEHGSATVRENVAIGAMFGTLSGKVSVDVVVDRLVLKPDIRHRLADAVFQNGAA